MTEPEDTVRTRPDTTVTLRPDTAMTSTDTDRTPADAQADRWARREQLGVLLSRAARGVLLPEEGPQLRAAVETELTDAEAAHAELARLRRCRCTAGRT